MIPEITIEEYMRQRSAQDLVLDIRDATSYGFGTLPGAVHFPMEEIGKLYRFPNGQKIYVFCQSGENSRPIVELLLDAGYDAYNLAGGYRAYLRWQLATQRGRTGENAERGKEC